MAQREATPKSYHTEKLSDRHHKVVLLAASGMQAKDIAKEVGYRDINRIYTILNNPLSQVLAARIRQRIEEKATTEHANLVTKFVAEGPRSVDRLIELRDQDENRGVARGAANDILDRIPEARRVPQAIQTDNIHRIVLDERAAELMREALTDAGVTIDANPIPVQTIEELEEELEEAGPRER